jgi:TRAP-type C4-dicarboxylate transport system permease small subunit
VRKRPIAILNNLFDRILDITALLSGALIIFLIISVCYEVFVRYFFNKPTTWVTEFGAYIMLWAPFLVAAYVLRAGSHITMDMFLEALTPKRRRLLILMTSSLAALVCLIITFFGIRVVAELYQAGERTETYLMLIKWPIMGIIPFSTFLLLIEFLRRICNLLMNTEIESGKEQMDMESVKS